MRIQMTSNCPGSVTRLKLIFEADKAHPGFTRDIHQRYALAELLAASVKVFWQQSECFE